MPAVIENLVTAALTVIALGLTLVAARAWRHARSRKVGLLTLGFALFLAKGLMLSIGLFTAPDWNRLLLPSLVFDLGILGVFYVAVMT